MQFLKNVITIAIGVTLGAWMYLISFVWVYSSIIDTAARASGTLQYM